MVKRFTRFFIYFIACLILIGKEASAQTGSVTGKITDDKGAPISFATVVLQGTQYGSSTKEDGSFEITSVPSGNYTLKITSIGYEDINQAVTVNGVAQPFSFSMKLKAHSLNEVVVVGYQSEKRARITGAVSDVDAGKIAKLPVGNVDQALQGQASGVRVAQTTGQPGEGVSVRIRGVGTINNDDPLYIIDGVPTKDGINFLSSSDIASITVLKDAASAAIYGARAANGVVVITTKSGQKGTPKFNFSAYGGIQTHGFLTPMTDAK